jgi:putative nucleotidyltransferase with HDIG domain
MNAKKDKATASSTDFINGQFNAVDIQVFMRGARRLGFDVFLKVSEKKLTQVFSRVTGVDYRRLAQYIKKGVKELYISKVDLAAFENYKKEDLEDALDDKNLSTDEKAEILVDLTNQNISLVCEMAKLPEELADKSKKIIHGFISALRTEPSVVANIMRGMNRNEYFFFHSVAVSMFSIMIAESLTDTNEAFKEYCGMAGLLHDIGKSKLPADLQNNIGADLLPEYQQHTKHGFRMLEGCPSIPAEVQLAVLQHHEEPMGSGFPSRLRDAKISRVAKVIAVADAFTKYITPPAGKKGLSSDQAIDNMLRVYGKYDDKILQAAANLFSSKRTKKLAA